MGQPFAFGHFHVGKGRLKGGVLRAAGIDTKGYLTGCRIQMADPHLLEMDAVSTALHPEIIRSSAEPVPHMANITGDFRGGPIGKAAVGHHAAQMLKCVGFIFDGCL